MTNPALPAAVIDAWNLAETRIHKIEGGFSGAEIYRCQHGDGSQTALRCWPAGTSADRVAVVHHVLRQSLEQGCPWVPQLLQVRASATVVTVGGRHWEHSQWMPGAPCQPRADAPQQLETWVRLAAAAVGQFQASVRHLESRSDCPPAVLERCQRWPAAQRWLQQPPLATDGSRWPAWLVRADAVLRSAWPLHHRRLETALTAASRQASPLQYVLRDCHHAHILFDATGTEVCGLIDFDALRVDTPATDLARLVHSFAALSHPQPGIVAGGRWDTPIQSWRNWIEQDLWAAAVAGFRQSCPFSDQQWELARLLADSTTLLSLINWITWVASDASPQRAACSSGTELVQNRVEQLSQFAINYLT